jgi:hypothetical protein
MRRNAYHTTKGVYIRGAGLRQYSRVIRGDGIGSIVDRVSKGLNKLWKNKKLRKKLRETATKIGQKVITDELQNRIVDKTSDVINKRIDKTLGDVPQDPSPTIEETNRARNRVNTIMDPVENKQVDDEGVGLTPLQIYLRNAKRQSGNGMVLPGRGMMGRKKKYKTLNATDMKNINGYINAVNSGNMGKKLSNDAIDKAKKFVQNPMKEINDIVNMVTDNIPILNAVKMTGRGCGKLQTLNRKDISDMNCVLKDMNDRKPIKCKPCLAKIYRMTEAM